MASYLIAPGIGAENSPEMAALQKKIDAWYPQILERYPLLKVEYKNVPDDQNGFLKIIEWQEELLPLSKDEFPNALNTKLPPGYLEKIDWDHLLANPQEIEAFLAPKKAILDRAMTIGLLPEQSSSGISSDRYLFRTSLFSNKIIKYLRLKAIAEAKQKNVKATLKTLLALKGWANHMSNMETPYLMSTTVATSIRLSLQSTIHNEILPLLAKDDIDYEQWAKLTESAPDLPHQWLKMWRGEWCVIAKSKWNTKTLLDENFSDPIAFMNASASVFNSISDPETFFTLEEWNTPPPPAKLTRKSRIFYEDQFNKDLFTSFGKGLLRSHTILRQYEISFALKKLEAEGHDLTKLDPTTLDSLPTQILPDLHLSIDFNKRQITAPKNKISNPKTISF